MLEKYMTKNKTFVSKRNYSKNIEYREAIPQYSSKWSEEFQKELKKSQINTF